MSVKVSGWVWEHAPVKSGELVVLLALADNAHDDGRGAYPSQTELARKARMTGRQVRNCLKALETAGHIRRQGVTQGGVVVWHVLMTVPEVGFRPEDSSGGNELPPYPGSGLPIEPSVEPSPSLLPSVEERSPAKKRRVETYRGKRVPVEVEKAAVRLLDHFNAVGGRDLTADSHLRQVVGGMLARPGVGERQWRIAIDHTVANPPSFIDGPLMIGHVFGPGPAADHALANNGVSKRRNGGGNGRAQANVDQAKRWLSGNAQ